MNNPLIEGKRYKLGYDYFSTGFSTAQLNEAYYQLCANRQQERLLLEAATLCEIEEVYNPGDENDRLTTEEMVMEAITIQKYSRADSKMAALVRVFNGYLKDKNIQALAPIIGTPKKSGLFATVTAQIPFSDGQVVSIIFHSPDNNKMKIMANDEIIAFRWLLNKRDITHVVSPENDAEVSLQEIGKRTAQLVEKNSTRFQTMQKEIVDQKKKLDDTKAQADAVVKQHDDLMASLKDSQDAIETLDAKAANLKDRIDKQKAFNDDLQSKIEALRAQQAGNAGKPAGSETPKTEEEMKAEQEIVEFANKKQAYLEELKGRGFTIDEDKSPKSEDDGNWPLLHTGLQASYGQANTAGHLVTDLGWKNGYFVGVLFSDPVGKKTEKQYKSATISGLDRITSKALAWLDKNLAGIKALEAKNQKNDMDNDQSQQQKVEQGQQGTEDQTTNNETGISDADFESLQTDFVNVMTARGAAINDHGTYSIIKNGVEITGNLARQSSTMVAIAATAYNQEKKTDEKFYHEGLTDTESVRSLIKQLGDWIDGQIPPDVNSETDQSAPDNTEPAAVNVLNDILAGKYDDDSTKLGDALDQAAADLERDGKLDQYDSLLNNCADHLTEVLKKEAA